MVDPDDDLDDTPGWRSTPLWKLWLIAILNHFWGSYHSGAGGTIDNITAIHDGVHNIGGLASELEGLGVPGKLVSEIADACTSPLGGEVGPVIEAVLGRYDTPYDESNIDVRLAESREEIDACISGLTRGVVDLDTVEGAVAVTAAAVECGKEAVKAVVREADKVEISGLRGDVPAAMNTGKVGPFVSAIASLAGACLP